MSSAADLEAVRHRVPDEPRFLSVHALLASPHGAVVRDADTSALVIDTGFPFAALVGSLTETLAASLRELGTNVELLVQAEDLASAREQLGDWRVHPASCFRHPDPRRLPSASSVGRRPGPQETIDGHPAMTAELAEELRIARARGAPLAVVDDEQGPVSFCYGFLSTPRFWDVSVDTLGPARRRGHAREAFLTLAHALLSDGCEPVWGALDDNEASLAMARTLGFRREASLAVLTPPRARGGE